MISSGNKIIKNLGINIIIEPFARENVNPSCPA